MSTVFTKDIMESSAMKNFNCKSLESKLNEHFNKMVADTDLMKKFRQDFLRYGYVNFKNYSFLPKELLDGVHQEVNQLLERFSVRRDIAIPSTDNTYRKMYNVNQPEIKVEGKLIPNLYESDALKGFLGSIARDDIVECWEPEQYLITKLTHPGDTHGWHWGDYPYTLIWIIEAPEDPEIGGVLQCIPHTEWDKSNPQIWKYILNNTINSYHHLKGDVYFLKSDTTLHHVIPIQKKTIRIILNTCWASKHDRRDNIEHETIDAIWGNEVRAS